MLIELADVFDVLNCNVFFFELGSTDIGPRCIISKLEASALLIEH